MPAESSSDSNPSGGRAAVPAWKLRQSMNKGAPADRLGARDPKELLKKKMEKAALDPNLPPAFKVANKDRLAFAKQQNRRKNNDTFVSLNSSHPAAKESAHAYDDDDDDDESFVSMGEDVILEEE